MTDPSFWTGRSPVPTPASALPGIESGSTYRPTRRRGGRVGAYLLSLFGVLLLIAMGLLLAATVWSETGLVGFLLGTVLALLPVPVVVWAFLWVDRHEPEPKGILVFAFAWGAIVAALISSILNTASLLVIAQASSEETGLAASAVFVAPWVEEASKGLGVLLVLIFRRREFDGVIDGIVCAGMVGIGFAFTENVLYYGRAYLMGNAEAPGSGVLAAGATFVLRGIFSPFAHPMFTTMTGIGLGIAATTRFGLVRLVAPALGYLTAVGLHMTWNLSAVNGLSGFVSGYFAFMLPVFLGSVVVAVWVSFRERAAILAALPAYAAAGWIPAYDVAMIASPAGRRRARAWALSTQGKRAERAMAEYQDAALELGLLRTRGMRGQRIPDFAARERALLAELESARSRFQPAIR